MANPLTAYNTKKTGAATPEYITKTDVSGDKVALDVAVQTGTITGTVVPSGFTTAGKLTKETIDDTQWWPLPSSKLTNRNTLGVQNKTGQSVYLAWYDGGIPAFVATDGWELADNAEFFTSIDDSTAGTLYARTASGSVDLKLMEIS